MNATSRSIANLRVNKPPEDADLLDSLRDLAKACGTNKHDQAIAVIVGCISRGIADGAAIVEVGGRLGFDTRHIGQLLQTEAGPTPASGWWFKGPDRKYRLHEK